MPIPLYMISFTDKTEYHGGDLKSPLWREAPDKAIANIRLRLPTGDFLFIGGYEEYNLFIEASVALWGSKVSQPHFIYLMGSEKGIVTSYRIAISDYGQYKSGDFTVRKFPKGKEYAGKATTGWRKGELKCLQ